MGDFGIADGRDPYHLTLERNVPDILRKGLSARPEGRGDITWLNETLDNYRPRGYPKRTRSVYLHPGSTPIGGHGTRVPVFVDPAGISAECAVAEMDVTEDLAMARGDRAEVERLARKYWEGARKGSLAAVNGMGSRYTFPEILVPFRVPPRALSRGR